jgi:serine/threonine protein kinase
MFPQIFGKYVLEREIAAGGMARVFLATLRGAVGFEKRLVVKQIRSELAVDDAFVRRFVEEAKTAVELSHPNIVPVYELGVEQGVYYIAMEHCAGVTLAEVLAYSGALDAHEGAYVGAEVCRALDYAHRRAGIVHRDVTPRNVLLDDEGGVRLIDFGIAAPVEPVSGRPREVFGSPGHMPPEQLRGDPLGPRADVFAVGALLIEAWTGVAPFRRATADTSFKALRSAPERLDAELPELAPIADLVQKSVALDAAQRPADAEQLARGLRDFLRGADSVEIARRLGARVRSVHEKTQPSAPASASASAAASTAPDSTPPLVTPAGGAPVTRTFAARDEMVEWTRKLSSAPPPALGTRPLSSPPGPDTRRLSARPRPGADPAPFRWSRVAALAPVLFGAGALASVLASPSRQEPAQMAAVTPPKALERAAAGAATQPPAALPVASVLAATQPRAKPAADDASQAAAGTRAPARAPDSPPAQPSEPGVPQKPQEEVGTARAAASAAETEIAAATLRLTADPAALVSVEGAGFSQTNPTPVRALSLRPGSYRVSFRSETYASPVTTQVTLAAGAKRNVHADFRAAVPTVTVR